MRSTHPDLRRINFLLRYPRLPSLPRTQAQKLIDAEADEFTRGGSRQCLQAPSGASATQAVTACHPSGQPVTAYVAENGNPSSAGSINCYCGLVGSFCLELLLRTSSISSDLTVSTILARAGAGSAPA